MIRGTGAKLVHFSGTNPNRRANSACLALSYLVVAEGFTPEEAWALVADVKPAFKGFVDASQMTHEFTLSILDVLRGLHVAVSLGWYDYSTFHVEHFDNWKRIEVGDMSWIIPNKFIAFAGPFDDGLDDDGLPVSSPETYHSHFKEAGVTTVVRLNKRQYDASKFITEGFRHVDLIFNDGSCPPDHIRDTFLKLAAKEPTLAVHCKAGLGRTGTLIALHAMTTYKFPARAFIGWIRTCRPGSILGVQQDYLVEVEEGLLALQNPSKGITVHVTQEMMKEDVGQGERLTRAKANRKYSSSTTASMVSESGSGRKASLLSLIGFDH